MNLRGAGALAVYLAGISLAIILYIGLAFVWVEGRGYLNSTFARFWNASAQETTLMVNMDRIILGGFYALIAAAAFPVIVAAWRWSKRRY